MFDAKQRTVAILTILFLLSSANLVSAPEQNVQADQDLFQLDDRHEKAVVKNETADEIPDIISTMNPATIAAQIPTTMSVTALRSLLIQLSSAHVHAPEIQQEILTKLVPVFISCAQEHALQALHDIAQQMACLEYRKYHWFKSLFVQPTDIFYGSIEPRYNVFCALQNRYFNALGRLGQLSDPSTHDMHEWVTMVTTVVNGLKESSTTKSKPSDYAAALQSLRTGCDTIYANDVAFCKRGAPLVPISISRAAYWTGRTGVSLGMCAGGGFLISKYLANLNAADIVQVKQNYQRAVTNFHTQFNIPGVTQADIDRAADNLDAGFLEDRVIPAITHRVRTINDWIPDLVQRVVTLRRQWVPAQLEEVLRKIPARTIAVATTIIWLADKTMVDILPWGVETVVGATAWIGTAAFVDRIVAVADALITAAGGVSVVPDMGMLLALVYKKKMKLAALKYGGGVAGFIGLYALYRTVAKFNESKLSEHLTHQVHGMIATLAPYGHDATGLTMQPVDFGKVLHAVDQIRRQLSELESEKQRLFDNDIVALQSVQTSASNRMQLLDSMYHTYSLVTVAV